MSILNKINELIEITESITPVGELVGKFGKGIHSWLTSGHAAKIQGLENQIKNLNTQHTAQLLHAKNLGNLKGTVGVGVGSATTATGLDQYHKYKSSQQDLENSIKDQTNRTEHPITSKLVENPKVAAAAGVGGVAGVGAGLGYAAAKLRKKHAVTESLGHALTAIGGLGLGAAAGGSAMEYQKNIEIAQNHLRQHLTNYDTAVKSAGAGAGGALGALGVGMLGHAIYKNVTKDTDSVQRRAK
jgi:hypothetical protein